ncbi:MAG: WYL domain-containing protein [Deltaproteobacteria bacterium]|jgi:hypothetical protein|nr:WYL domain-containing protein [Deltaproteobacteria bacterium]
MPQKLEANRSPGEKLLLLLRKLICDGRRHYLSDLGHYLRCSPQTVLRLVDEIEKVFGDSLERGKDGRKSWYRLSSKAVSGLGMGQEEVRYLGICRDLAAGILPKEIVDRVDRTLLSLSLSVSEENPSGLGESAREFIFFSKGRIDYTPHRDTIEKLIRGRAEKRVCVVKYRATGRGAEDPRQHFFAPGRIVSLNNALYVLGAGVEESGAFRHWMNLAVHRIRLIAFTDVAFSFEVPDAAPETFGFPIHEPKSFSMRFREGKAADYVKERIWASEQSMRTESDGSLVLTVTTRSEPELMAWVRSFGDECELL